MSATRPLTEEAIVSAALAVIERDGVESLSMRALSRELAVSPMAAYYYVKSKEDLLDLVAERVLAGIAPPARTDLEWPARLRLLVDQIEAALRHHRGIGDVLLEGPTEDEDIVARIRPLFPKLRGRDYYDFGIETLVQGLQRQLELKRP